MCIALEPGVPLREHSPSTHPASPDEVLDLLYRSGEPRDLGATARQWLDLFAMGCQKDSAPPGAAASATSSTR